MNKILSFYLILGLIGSNVAISANAANNTPDQNNQLSGGAIAGITAGSVVAFALLAIVLIYTDKKTDFFKKLLDRLESLLETTSAPEPTLAQEKLKTLLSIIIEIAKNPEITDADAFVEAIKTKLDLQKEGGEVLTFFNKIQTLWKDIAKDAEQLNLERFIGEKSTQTVHEEMEVQKAFELIKDIISKFETNPQFESLVQTTVKNLYEDLYDIKIPEEQITNYEQIETLIKYKIRDITVDIKLATIIQDEALKTGKTFSTQDIYDYIQKNKLTDAQYEKLWSNIKKVYATPKPGDPDEPPKDVLELLKAGLSDVGLNLEEIVNKIYLEQKKSELQKLIAETTYKERESLVEMGQGAARSATSRYVLDAKARNTLKDIIDAHNILNPERQVGTNPATVRRIYDSYKSAKSAASQILSETESATPKRNPVASTAPATTTTTDRPEPTTFADPVSVVQAPRPSVTPEDLLLETLLHEAGER